MKQTIIIIAGIIIIGAIGFFVWNYNKAPVASENAIYPTPDVQGEVPQTTNYITHITATEQTQPIQTEYFYPYEYHTPTPVTTPTPQTYNVTIQNFSFNQSALTVKKGDTVVWTNKDSAPHTVTG